MANKLNTLLMQGILPDELNFGKPAEALDLDKIRYNSFYKQFDYHLNKLPKAIHKIVGIDSLVQEEMKNALTPLEAIDLRINRLEENIDTECINEKEERSEDFNSETEWTTEGKLSEQ
jgi:hypothetical protein